MDYYYIPCFLLQAVCKVPHSATGRTPRGKKLITNNYTVKPSGPLGSKILRRILKLPVSVRGPEVEAKLEVLIFNSTVSMHFIWGEYRVI